MTLFCLTNMWYPTSICLTSVQPNVQSNFYLYPSWDKFVKKKKVCLPFLLELL